jgi:uncharacterized protein YjbK
MNEYEYKFFIDLKEFKEYKKLIENEYSTVNKIEKMQINYYYDTNNHDLNKKNITLRVRQTEQNLLLQLKIHKFKKDGYVFSNEQEYKLNELKNILYLQDDKTPYLLQGSLITLRTSYMISDGLKIEFDKNYFLGKVDYEIEIEFEKDLTLVNNFISKLKLNSLSNEGKATRFFTQLLSMKN